MDGDHDHRTGLLEVSRRGHADQCGRVMDLACRYMPRYANKLWFMVLLGGFAHATKPVGQIIVNLLTGWPIGSFRFGVAYPFTSHLLFGMIGGLLGALVVLGLNRFSNKSNQG